MDCCQPTGDPLYKPHYHFVATTFTAEKMKEFLKARAAACRARIDAAKAEHTKAVEREVADFEALLARIPSMGKTPDETSAIIAELNASFSRQEAEAERGADLEALTRPLTWAIEDFEALAENIAEGASFVLEAEQLLALYRPERERAGLREIRASNLNAGGLLKHLKREGIRRAREALGEEGNYAMMRSETKQASEFGLR